jgi:hypothetical protein
LETNVARKITYYNFSVIILAVTKFRVSPTAEATSHPASKKFPSFCAALRFIPIFTGIYSESGESSPQFPIPFI